MLKKELEYPLRWITKGRVVQKYKIRRSAITSFSCILMDESGAIRFFFFDDDCTTYDPIIVVIILNLIASLKIVESILIKCICW